MEAPERARAESRLGYRCPMSEATALQVRAMEHADLPEVLRIQAACYTEIVPEGIAAYQAKLRAPGACCMVAERGGALQAYLVAVPVRWPALPALDDASYVQPADADTLYLHDLAVDPRARGSGAGSVLVREVLRHVGPGGWPRAGLVAIQGSVPYWSRFGFRPVAPPDEQARAKLASYGDGAQLMMRG